MLSWTHAELPETQLARRSRGPRPHWMEMKIRLLFVPLLLALVASLAACGGSQHVPANAVAVVNGTPITITQFNDFIDQAIAQVKAQGGAVPTPGSPQYSDLRART